MNVTTTPSGLQRVNFTPADVEALLLTAAQSELGLGNMSSLYCYLPIPAQLPAIAGFVVQQPAAVAVFSNPDGEVA
jgi:hypothetical protein